MLLLCISFRPKFWENLTNPLFGTLPPPSESSEVSYLQTKWRQLCPSQKFLSDMWGFFLCLQFSKSSVFFASGLNTGRRGSEGFLALHSAWCSDFAFLFVFIAQCLGYLCLNHENHLFGDLLCCQVSLWYSLVHPCTLPKLCILNLERPCRFWGMWEKQWCINKLQTYIWDSCSCQLQKRCYRLSAACRWECSY